MRKYRWGMLGDEIFDWGLRDRGTSPVLSVELLGGFLYIIKALILQVQPCLRIPVAAAHCWE